MWLDLFQLAKLKETGVLTEVEFAQAKQALLDSSQQSNQIGFTQA